MNKCKRPKLLTTLLQSFSYYQLLAKSVTFFFLLKFLSNDKRLKYRLFPAKPRTVFLRHNSAVQGWVEVASILFGSVNLFWFNYFITKMAIGVEDTEKNKAFFV